jgi:hypothetical protein
MVKGKISQNLTFLQEDLAGIAEKFSVIFSRQRISVVLAR